MKKTLTIVAIWALLLTGAISNINTKQAVASDTVPAGTVIKGTGLSTLYYLAEDGKRYVFPNDKVFFSWYDDFSQVKEIPTEELYNYPLGGNVTYRPGILLVKIQTDPKVYAVGENGKLRWIKTEGIAKALYGENWNKLVDDVPDSFFTNYAVTNEIDAEEDFSPIDEEESIPTISHNRGLKAKITARIRTQQEKMCGHLEGAINKLQKRLDRWNIEIPTLGDDLLNRCYGVKNDDTENDDAPKKGNKVTLCHNGETLSVGAPASRAHIKHGDILGACTNDTDNTAPEISSINVSATGTTATITWSTNENATGKVSFSTTTPIPTTASFLLNNNYTTNHSLELTGLATGTKYYYLIESKDMANNIATSAELFFTSAQ